MSVRSGSCIRLSIVVDLLGQDRAGISHARTSASPVAFARQKVVQLALPLTLPISSIEEALSVRRDLREVLGHDLMGRGQAVFKVLAPSRERLAVRPGKVKLGFATCCSANGVPLEAADVVSEMNGLGGQAVVAVRVVIRDRGDLVVRK